MPQKATEITMAIMRLSLGDIARNRHRGTPDLIRKTIDFFFRKAVSKLIDLSHKIHGLLPSHEILKMLGHSSAPCWVLSTRYRVLFFNRFLLAEAGFHSRTNARQHVFGWLRQFSVGLKFEILLEGLGRAFGCDHFVAL
jgi:hypothetical protein